MNYQPLSCLLIHHLQEISSRQLLCSITYLNHHNQFVHVSGQIRQLYSVDDSDWCQLSDGSTISLDRIEEFQLL